VVLGEEAVPGAVLEVEDAARRTVADGGAQHGLDLPEAHAFPRAEALVEQRRRRDDRLPGRDRLGDDAARDGGAHARELLGREAVRERPARRPRVVLVVELEVAVAGAGDLDDQAERLAEEGLGLLLAAETEPPAGQV